MDAGQLLGLNQTVAKWGGSEEVRGRVVGHHRAGYFLKKSLPAGHNWHCSPLRRRCFTLSRTNGVFLL